MNVLYKNFYYFVVLFIITYDFLILFAATVVDNSITSVPAFFKEKDQEVPGVKREQVLHIFKGFGYFFRLSIDLH